jgi:hypothetical protein
MVTRNWQRDLEDPESDIARRERERENAIDLHQYVKDVLSGAIGDCDVSTRDNAITAVEESLVSRFRRPLSSSEKTAIMMAVILAWRADAETEKVAVLDIQPASVQSREDELHVEGRGYFANAADAAFWRKVDRERGERQAARERARCGEQGAA